MDRRTSLKMIGTTLLGSQFMPDLLVAPSKKMNTRTIPTSGEELLVVGLGTWRTFDVGNDADKRQQLKEVLKILVEKGGTVVDSSPMYGTSEEVVGDLSSLTNLQNELFLATKVWTSGMDSGVRQMEKSMRLMQTTKMELMQIHNLLDWQTHLKTLRAWKASGKINYWGITHYHSGAYDEMIKVIKSEQPDFVQINFSLAERESIDRLIPTAADQGAAVIINRPYGGGSLFRKIKGKSLPDWTADFDANSWGQVFLKYILSHQAINCVIPGTSKPKHMLDNAQAGFGRLPNAKQRKKIEQLLGV